MKELGLFGVTIPEEYGGMGLDLTTYAMIVEELCRGWISISGIVNTHFIGSYLLMKFGTDEQKQRLPAADGHGRDPGGLRLSEPEPGSDVQAIKTSRQEGGDGTARSTARRCGSPTACVRPRLRARQDRPRSRPALQGHDLLHRREGAGREQETGSTPGSTVPPKIKKMGYKGVELTELVFDGFKCPRDISSAARTGASARASAR